MKQDKRVHPLPLAGACLLLALGATMLLWPDAILRAFPPLIGFVLVLVGAQGLVYSIVMHARLAQPGLRLLRSLLNIAVGVIFIVKHDLSLAFLTILFGLYVVVMAFTQFSETLAALRAGRPWLPGLIESILQLLLGALLLFAPFSERNLWVQVLGIYFILAAGSAFLWLLRESRGKNETHQQDE